MPLLIVIGVAARFLLKYMVTKAMLVLGLGFVSYLGVDTMVEQIESYIMTQYSGLPADAYAFASLAGLDVAVTIIISTLLLSMQIKLLSAGTKLLTRVGR